MILYHSSYTRIGRFEIPVNGLHFGSLKSSLEAGLRKAYKYNTNVYVHKCACYINSTNRIDYDDLGEDWSIALSELKEYNKDWIRYTNKYEPSISKSYMTNNIECVGLLNVTKYTIEEAERLLESLEDYRRNYEN